MVVNRDFAERQSKISEALEDVGLSDLEVLLTPRSNLASGIVHVELLKLGRKVGEILYDKEPPRVTFYDPLYSTVAEKLKEYFTK